MGQLASVSCTPRCDKSACMSLDYMHCAFGDRPSILAHVRSAISMGLCESAAPLCCSDLAAHDSNHAQLASDKCRPPASVPPASRPPPLVPREPCSVTAPLSSGLGPTDGSHHRRAQQSCKHAQRPWPWQTVPSGPSQAVESAASVCSSRCPSLSRVVPPSTGSHGVSALVHVTLPLAECRPCRAPEAAHTGP